MNSFGTAPRYRPQPIFPTVQWNDDSSTFVPATPPLENGVTEPVALVFPFYGNRIVLADIESRGWCIPSGHIDEGETAEMAVRREALEEAGAALGRTAYIGHFVLIDTRTGAVRHAPTFIADVIGFSELPAGSESRGMQMVAVEDVAEMYFSWDALLAAVFEYAQNRKEHLLRPGTSISRLTESDSTVI